MKVTLFTGFCVLLMLASNSSAVLTTIGYEDLPEQDKLYVPPVVHELGIGFPPEEAIEAVDTITDLTACPEDPGDDPALFNALVVMTNLTNTAWTEVWYVADGFDWMNPMETSLTNFDGLVNGMLAFKIDYWGVNQPLVSESMAPDGVFEPGETWEFIIQDYQNLFNLPASALGSIGVPSPFPADPLLSSGSIIAIPEPMSLLLLGAGALLIRKRK